MDCNYAKNQKKAVVDKGCIDKMYSLAGIVTCCKYYINAWADSAALFFGCSWAYFLLTPEVSGN